MSKREKGGNNIPKNTQLMLLTVGTRRSELNRIFWARREKYLGKAFRLHAHPVEYPVRAGKIS
jgi:hypothetical protein